MQPPFFYFLLAFYLARKSRLASSCNRDQLILSPATRSMTLEHLFEKVPCHVVTTRTVHAHFYCKCSGRHCVLVVISWTRSTVWTWYAHRHSLNSSPVIPSWCQMLTFGKPPKHFSLQHDSTGVPTTQLLQSLETALPVLFHSVFVQNTLQQDVLAETLLVPSWSAMATST